MISHDMRMITNVERKKERKKERKNLNHSSSRINYICLTAAIGGLLFGFDTAVISGTIGFVKTQFALTASEEGWFVSSGLLGCILGVIASGFLSDRIGRRGVMIIA